MFPVGPVEIDRIGLVDLAVLAAELVGPTAPAVVQVHHFVELAIVSIVVEPAATAVQLEPIASQCHSKQVTIVGLIVQSPRPDRRHFAVLRLLVEPTGKLGHGLLVGVDSMHSASLVEPAEPLVEPLELAVLAGSS